MSTQTSIRSDMIPTRRQIQHHVMGWRLHETAALNAILHAFPIGRVQLNTGFRIALLIVEVTHMHCPLIFGDLRV